MNKNSEILAGTLEFFYPFILIFGLYIIFNGHITPGGGFQGGAILASLFICKYIVAPDEKLELYRMQTLEKLLFVLIILLFTFFLVLGLNTHFPEFNPVFLVLANFLIGIKVCCGLCIIFFRFVFYESR